MGSAEPAEPVQLRSSGVQSLDRAFGVLQAMADAGGVLSLSQLAARTGLALGTVHRLVRALVDLGYLRQEDNREYSLGPRLLRLSDATARRAHSWAEPHMAEAVRELDESVNLASMDGDEIVYLAQVQPRNNYMRMFTEVGRRTLPHSTAVGKAMLIEHDAADVRALLARTGMPRLTEHTLTTPEEFLAAVDEARERGYATDEGEQELGVRCVAVPVPGARRPLALSMSGPTSRVDDAAAERAADVLRAAAEKIAADLAG